MRLGVGMVRPCNMLHGVNHVVHSFSSISMVHGGHVRVTNSLSRRNYYNPCFISAHSSTVLSDKWSEYQGIKNWEGLLDPLDDSLRNEILRYGDFVETSYRAFEFNTSSPSYATCRYPNETILTECGLGKSGYKVIKDLYTSCAVQIPKRWMDKIPSWVSTQTSWIGYIAVCDDKAEIDRLGRREVVIAYRGTATCLEWMENLRATLTYLPENMAPKNCEAMVQSGFLSLYTSGDSNKNFPSLQSSIREEISKVLDMYGDEPLSLTITGHSLGAALATLTACDIASTFKHAPLVTVISFGGPRVGNKMFRRLVEDCGTKVLRIVNSDDPITRVPGFVMDENDVAAPKMAGLMSWLRKRMEDTRCGWVYSDVGKELRVSSKECPYLKKGGVATCHDLKTYLHLLSYTCPIKATAKRVVDRVHGVVKFS